MLTEYLERVDFGLALATGGKTRFFRDDGATSPNIAPSNVATGFPELCMISPSPDPRLLTIWADIREFSSAANKATETGVKMTTSFFIKFVTSAPGRLVNLSLEPGSIDELMRLCMMAYLKSVLIQIEGIGMKMTVLAEDLKAALLAQQRVHAPKLDELLLWTLFVSAVSVFETSDKDWLSAMMMRTVSSLGLQTWGETRAVLKSFLWINMIFDTAGKRFFDRCMGTGVAKDSTSK